MYAYFKGELLEILPTAVILEVQGIGYHIAVANPYRLSKHLNQEVRLYIKQIVREDALTLYGFLTAVEKDLFEQLLSVKGIGPKSALSFLATDDLPRLAQAIDHKDERYLTKFPGVGKKIAGQLMLDLAGKLTHFYDDKQLLAEAGTSKAAMTYQQVIQDVEAALLGLGYSAREIKRIWSTLQASEFATTQEGLSIALKLLVQ